MKKNLPQPFLSEPPPRQPVRFTFTHPTAKCVRVAGSFNGWRTDVTPMMAIGKGRWQKEIILHPGTYEYRFVVDGAWLIDPLASETVPNPFGGYNSVVRVSLPR